MQKNALNIGNYFWHAQVCLNILKWTESSKCIYVCLTTCIKSSNYLSSLLRNKKIAVFHHFGHVWSHPLEMTEQICYFCGSLTTCKKQLYSSIHSGDQPDSLFGANLGMTKHVGPQSLEMTGCVTTYKNISSYLNLLVRHFSLKNLAF